MVATFKRDGKGGVAAVATRRGDNLLERSARDLEPTCDVEVLKGQASSIATFKLDPSVLSKVLEGDVAALGVGVLQRIDAEEGNSCLPGGHAWDFLYF